jgi:hypothetical protein
MEYIDFLRKKMAISGNQQGGGSQDTGGGLEP